MKPITTSFCLQSGVMLAQYTTEQRVNIVKSYYRTNSVTSTARKFATENECAKPSRNTIHRLINKFEETGSVLDESAWLDDHLPDRWIGRRGAIEWPPRSPDLTPPDFFLWGVLKDLVYSEKPRTIAALKDVICNKIAMIELDLGRKVCRSVPSRLQKCIKAQGAPTELF